MKQLKFFKKIRTSCNCNISKYLQNKKVIRYLSILCIFVFINSSCNCKREDKSTINQKNNSGKLVTLNNNKMEHLTAKTFKEKVFNYEQNREWKFEGKRPCIIDFYADWCGPCKMVSPVLEELSKEYAGKVDFYKVDTEDQQELAGAFGIRSIPSILFCPLEGQPQMLQGALPKKNLDNYIQEILLNKK
jgi:thioredoxin